MGSSVSLLRSDEGGIYAVWSPGVSHLQSMTAYLDTIPTGAASQDKVKRVRLVKKRALLAHPAFVELFAQLSEAIREISVHHVTEGGEYGTGARRVAKHAVTDKGLKAIERFASQSAEKHVVFEEMLFWRSDSTDPLCEIFDLDECPPFTFVSHRWAAEGRALGLHNELVFLLAFVPEEYIWLDCCCSPQDKASFESGNCLKVIWNIASLLDRATSIVTYYATDGVQVTVHTEDWDGKRIEVQTLSHGLARLFQCATQSQDVQFLEDLAVQDSQGSARLWCVLEKRVGKDKIVKTLRSSLFAPSSSTSDLYAIEPRRIGASRTNLVIAFQESTALHEANKFSLDCFCAADIEPVTAVMFQRGVVPMMFKDNWPVVPDEDKGGFIHAIRLPRIVARDEGYRKTCDILDLNGWYYNDVLARNVFSAETFHINILWPQNPSIPEIRLQIHVPCLLEYNQSLWCYDADKVKKGFFNRAFDSTGRLEVYHRKCLFCI